MSLPSRMPFSPLPQEDLEHVLQHTRPLWKELRGSRLFVTGATGFFGKWLLESFAYANEHLSLDATLLGLSRDPDTFVAQSPHLATHPAIQFHQGDVRDFSFPSGSFSHVIHAGTTSAAPVPPLEMLETIIDGTRRMLDFALAARAKRFLFVSSGAVYGRQPSEITHIPESYQGGPDPMNPLSAYGEGKRAGELLCALYHQQHGLETAIARCFTFVGPHLPLNAHFAIGNFIRDTLRGESIQIKDGRPYRSYLYIADLVIWLWTILFKGQPCSPYNVGSDQEISIADLAQSVGTVMTGRGINKEPSSQILTSTIFQPSRYVPSIALAKTTLDLQVWITLEEAIRRTTAWNLC